MRTTIVFAMVCMLAGCATTEPQSLSAPRLVEPVKTQPATSEILVRGTYWVQRKTSRHTRGSATPEETRESGYTRCHRVEIKDTGLILFGKRADQIVEFSLEDARLNSPRVRNRHVRLSARCSQSLDILQSTPGQVYTNLGPLFREQTSCEQAPQKYTERCRDGACSWEGARPFDFQQCEDELRAMASDLAAVLGASHDEAISTLERLSNLTIESNTIFRSNAGVERCVPVEVEAKGAQRFVFTTGYVQRDGGQVREEATYRIAPLQFQARRLELNRNVIYESGGGGGSGSDQSRRVTLYLAADAFLLDEEWFFFERVACR